MAPPIPPDAATPRAPTPRHDAPPRSPDPRRRARRRRARRPARRRRRRRSQPRFRLARPRVPGGARRRPARKRAQSPPVASATRMSTPASATRATPASPPRAPLRRDPVHGKLGGVAAGLANRLGVDPLAIRIGFVVATFAGGWGALVYLLLWAGIPAGDGADAAGGRFRTGRASIEVALGAALLLLATLLVARHLGIWWSDALVWPVVLVAGGAAVLWRQTLAGPVQDAEDSAP